MGRDVRAGRLIGGCGFLSDDRPGASLPVPPVARTSVRLRISWRLGSSVLLLLAVFLAWTCAGVASAQSASKLVRYQRYKLVVPATWPVYNLASDPSVCVRFNRHAVYLGRPSTNQRCPAHEVGRTEAILVEPLAARGASGAGMAPALPQVTRAAAQPQQGSAAQVGVPARGVIVTATWRSNPGLIKQALGVRSLGAMAAAAAAKPAPSAGARAAAASTPGGVYTGLGFDPCSTPSTGVMSDWTASPYRAVGVYIGGTNMGCSQPNLTSGWVSRESAAGWHLIPTYVGLQAPSNSCGCSGIAPSYASSEGTAAANDAIARSRALGLGAGNPIYFDMEAYPRGGTNTSSVLAFLSSWTAQLHANGYKSGVYSSASAAMVDLANKWGTGYREPDDIWIADWNGELTTIDPFVPGGDWSAHQRLHQYSGGHNETYRGATINIDGDYLDGATAGTAAVTQNIASAPSLTVSPNVNGTIDLYASWVGKPGLTAWQPMAGMTPSSLASFGSAATAGSPTEIVFHSQFPYFSVQALGSGGQVLGSSPTIATPAHLAIYGASAFVSPGGVGGVPVGCFTPSVCQVVAKIYAGRTLIASTGPQLVPMNGGGLVYFRLTATGRAKLARSHRRLPVQLTVRDRSGTSATTTLNLIPFTTFGAAPGRSLSQASALRILSLTDFISAGSVGGIAVDCLSATPCQLRTTVTVGNTVVASTGSERVGVDELGYLTFKLTAGGKAMLARANGNQLLAHVSIIGANATATGTVALVKFI
ncbi:MAG: DUF1906 domain-containing protein [Solirubrobacterales bacterium]|nr:DUF1906 domain-containing protein [Solirubrobacterales bacterium]